MKLSSVSSGSKGNCILVENKDTTVLVDVGISKKKVEEGLSYFQQNPADIDGILITHEHSDHIRGLGFFSENIRFRYMLRKKLSTTFCIRRMWERWIPTCSFRLKKIKVFI